MLRRAYSIKPFQFGMLDSWLIYHLLLTQSTGICSVVGAIRIPQKAFEAFSRKAKTNRALWTGNSEYGHLGELVLQKFPCIRSIRIEAPRKHPEPLQETRGYTSRPLAHSSEDRCIKEKYELFRLSAKFFGDALKQGRIDKLELVIDREDSIKTGLGTISLPNPTYFYWSASGEPWNSFKSSKSVENSDIKQYIEPHKTWTVGYERSGAGDGV